METNNTRNWWKEGIVYQIYPRSFQDSNGDGIGDLRGIINRLDYIASLGVDIIWLNPIYDSPNKDNGYDIRDYRNILSEFGTMDDFDTLLQGMKDRGLRLVMDLVANHSSDQHAWFQASKKSRENPYRDYYHWWPEEKGTPPERWSYFAPDGNAWTYDPDTRAYYLHYFAAEQPDLKWENPVVRQEVYDILKYWFDKGVDGFRMDVISFISKDITYPPLPESYKADFIAYYSNGPRLHDFLQEMNREVLSKYDVMTVGETPGVGPDQALDFVSEDRKEINMFFQFDLMSLDRDPIDPFQARKSPWKLSEFKEIFSRWDAVFAEKGWNSLYLDNHDFPRAVSRWGNDHPDFWYHSATMLQAFILSMRGTPYIYFGEEIGMTNIGFTDPVDYRDINSLKKFEAAKNNGENLWDLIDNEVVTSRDNARTPMQWDNNRHAGFTSGDPWIKVNTNYASGVNVAEQERSETSVLNFFRKMAAFRKANPTLVYGSYELLLPEHEQVYAFTRKDKDGSFLVLLNFSEQSIDIELPNGLLSNAQLLLTNDEKKAAEGTKNGTFHLIPYHACIFSIQD